MCITQPNASQLFSSDLKKPSMHNPIANRTQEQKGNNTETDVSHTHKEYGDGYTTVCTQCNKVLVPSLVNSPSGISIRVSKEDDQWTTSEDLTSPPTSSLSHGLCRSCFNNMNATLTSSPITIPPPSQRRNSVLSTSLSSPHLTRPLPPPRAPPRVLIVDDSLLQTRIHKRMVEQEGYECDIANSGMKAIEMMEKRDYGIVLMDLVMAPLDGWTTSRKLRELHSASPSLLIFGVTGLQVDDKLKMECKEAGMDVVMQKPVSPSKLNKVLVHHTSRRVIDR